MSSKKKKIIESPYFFKVKDKTLKQVISELSSIKGVVEGAKVKTDISRDIIITVKRPESDEVFNARLEAESVQKRYNETIDISELAEIIGCGTSTARLAQRVGELKVEPLYLRRDTKTKRKYLRFDRKEALRAYPVQKVRNPKLAEARTDLCISRTLTKTLNNSEKK